MSIFPSSQNVEPNASSKIVIFRRVSRRIALRKPACRRLAGDGFHKPPSLSKKAVPGPAGGGEGWSLPRLAQICPHVGASIGDPDDRRSDDEEFFNGLGRL
jgi:hypothetical protein